MVIEKELINYLIECDIDGIGNNVFAITPATMPSDYIIIKKTSSGMDDMVNSAMVAVQSVSNTSLLNALDTNELVKQAMLDMPQHTNIYQCSLNSDYNYTDTTTKQYRYQAVFNLYY